MGSVHQAAPGQAQKPSKRTELWAVPLGCLGLILMMALLFFAVVGMMRNSQVHRLAMAYVRQDEQMEKVLGKPIKDGWLMSGRISTSNGSGQAMLSIPLSGPRGEGRLYAEATRAHGEWRFSTLVVKVEGEEDLIDLLGRSDDETDEEFEEDVEEEPQRAPSI